MRVLWLVIKDLFQFVFGYFNTKLNTDIVLRSELTPSKMVNSYSKSSAQALVTEAVIILPGRVMEKETKVESLHEPTIMYVCEVGGTLCLGAPYEEFDMAIDNFTYGTAVTVLSFRGRYARIWKLNNEGWVLKDALTPNKSSVWPNFVSDTVYSFEADETRKVRLLLNDIFLAGHFSLPLQAGEYILYRLLADNRQIYWPTQRPRTAGNWQRILKGVVGIHISIYPRTDSIMEWIDEDEVGHLAYVESVSPDNTLILTSVGLTELGIFSDSVMLEKSWRELRPVFIEVA